MVENELHQWIAEYLEVFAACGRGERDAVSLLAYYGVPLLLSTDDGFVSLTSDAQVLAMAKQFAGGVEAGYHHSKIIDAEVSVLNATSALYRVSASRVRDDGNESGRLTATYFVTEGADGRRISAIAAEGV